MPPDKTTRKGHNTHKEHNAISSRFNIIPNLSVAPQPMLERDAGLGGSRPPRRSIVANKLDAIQRLEITAS
jgi:hypothetical protein